VRPSFLYGVLLIPWIFITAVNFHAYGFYLVPAVLGGAFGLILNYAQKQRQLKAIEKNGEWIGTRKYNVLVILAAIIVIVAYLLIVVYDMAILNPSVSFVDMMLLSGYSSYSLIFLIWEKKHKKEILIEGGWLQGRIYASEKTPPPPPRLPPPPPPPDL
jgi:hypothetical protein